MKSMLKAAVAAAALLAAAPAMAQDAGGFVGLAYGQQELETPFGDADGDAWGAEGSVAFKASGDLVLQFDVNYTEASDADYEAVNGTAHVFTRNADYAFGGFVGLSDVESSTSWYAGVEAANFFDTSTVAVGLGYANLDDLDVDLWGVTGEYRWFATDNVRVDGRLGWQTGEFEDESTDAWNFGVGAEWKIGDSPVSLYATYDSFQFNDFDIDVNTALIGVRFNFGQGSLKDRDRSGPTFRSQGGFDTAARALSF